MRYATQTLFLAGFLAMSASAQASVSLGPAFMSGNELLAKCEAVPRYAASPNDPRKSAAQAELDSTVASIAGGYCIGFIAGASDMIEAATQNFVCRPTDTTPAQIENLFIAYLQRHPDKGEQAAVGLIGSALGEAFHC